MPPIPDTGLLLTPAPRVLVALIDTRMIKENNHVVTYWLIHWSNSAPEDATWEPAVDLLRNFTPLILGVKDPLMGEVLMQSQPIQCGFSGSLRGNALEK